MPADTDTDQTPLVSVLICAYNAGEYLRPSVESALSQTWPDLEIIVVDDGSEDGSIATLADLEGDRLTVLTQENAGKAAAMNLAIAAAHGKFIACQDADDLSHPQRVERQVTCLLRNSDVAAVFCGHELLIGKKHIAPRTRLLDREQCGQIIDRMALPALDPTAMYRRDLIEGIEFEPDLRLAQGLDFILRLGELHPFLVLGECLYTYRIIASSATHADVEQRMEYVHRVCVSACRRRGIPEENARLFYQDRQSLGRRRIQDNNLPSHFMESCLDLRRSGQRLLAVRNALRCSTLAPLDYHYHKALAYSLLPLFIVHRLRSTANRKTALYVGEAVRSVSPAIERRERSVSRGQRPQRLCLFGAAADTGNLGVSALNRSVLGAIARSSPETDLTVFDNGWGLREEQAVLWGKTLDYHRCGVRLSRRYHRRESFWNMRMSSRFGGLGNPGARAVLEADAIWDASGGDSFGDLYGDRNLAANVAPKEIALERGIPLVLLPQTYGPFRSEENRRLARRILRGASMAWARDAHSYEALKELLGSSLDPQRHRLGVDVAFAMEACAPTTPLPEQLLGWLEDDGPPTVGINVSGLIYNDPDANAKYGLRVNYQLLLKLLIGRFLRETDARIVLVPHVLVPEEFVESDAMACRAVWQSLSPEDRERVCPLDTEPNESEVKWLVAQLDWFTGTRMHSCIGALSSGVATAGLAYSLKTQGVFESCGQGKRVIDLRTMRDEEALGAVWSAWEEREECRRTLGTELPAVIRLASEQIVETLRCSARESDLQPA